MPRTTLVDDVFLIQPVRCFTGRKFINQVENRLHAHGNESYLDYLDSLQSRLYTARRNKSIKFIQFSLEAVALYPGLQGGLSS